MMVKNTLWLLSEKLLKLLGAVVISALIARHLQPEGFGILNFYLAILSILAVLSSLGLNRIVVREIVSTDSRTEHADILKTTLYLRLLASAAVFVVAVACARIFITEHDGRYAAIVFISIVFNASETLDFYQQGVARFKVVSIVRLIAFIISACAKLCLVFWDAELIWFFGANLLEYVVAAILIFKYCARDGSTTLLSVGQFNVTKAKTFISESWPEIIAGFSAILFLKTDQIMLFYLASEVEVGIYSAAARLSEAWYFVPTAIVATTFPKIVALKKQDGQYKAFLAQLFTLLSYLSIFVALLVTLLADTAIALIFGALYSDSSQVLVIHTWAGLFLCMGIASGSWLAAEKKLKLNLYRNLFGLAVNFVGNLLLIPKYGATGAAIAMVMGVFSAFYLFDLFLPQLRFMFLSKTRSLSIFQFINLIKTGKAYINSRLS